MDTQAAVLRARVAAMHCSTANSSVHPAPVLPTGERHLARTLAVASGKGGVGKSTISLGIALAAAERGVKTAIVDADLGLANLDLLCGVRPAHTAADWLAGRAQLSACFTTIAPRLWLLAGASGVAKMADLERPQRERLLDGLNRIALHVDLMIVDLGAGIGAGTLDIAAAADRLLVIATPEPTSLADAYGFSKACVRHGRREGWCCAASMTHNNAEGSRAMQRLSDTASTHLGIQFAQLGCIPKDDAVGRSVRARRPLLLDAPRSHASLAIRAIEARLAGRDVEDPSPTRFFSHLAARLGVQWGPVAAAVVAGVAGLGGVTAG